MKRTSVLVGAALLATSVFTAATVADIIGSPHDFTLTSWGSGEVCKPCHTPHFAEDVGYLWAHELSVATYTLFDGTTSSAGGVTELDVYSRMCLSCHDGTVALNSYHNGGGVDVYIIDAYKIGADGDLSDDHPIGNTAHYPIAGSSQFNPAVLSPAGYYGFGGGYFPTVPLFPMGTDEVVSCSTCHTPHAKAGIDHLLRMDNAGSALCLTCHIK
mgnify:FL=1